MAPSIRMDKKAFKPQHPIPTGEKKRGSLEMPISAVLFDIYGTLFISGSGDIGHEHLIPTDTKAMEALILRYKIDATPNEINRLLKEKITTCHRHLKKKNNPYPEVVIESIWQSLFPFKDIETAQRFAMEYEAIHNPVYPMPGMEKLIDGLHGKKIILGLISNAQFYTPLLFETFFSRTLASFHFHPELCLFSYALKTAKPGSKMFQLSKQRLKQMGINEKRVVFVGNDMRNDIAPARQTGFQTVLFAGDQRSLRKRTGDPELSSVRPDLVITNLSQLLSILTIENGPESCYQRRNNQ